jgi:mRNA interferase RelE/StbE
LTWQLQITPGAEKDIRSLSDPNLTRVNSRILQLERGPFQTGVIKLKVGEGYRIRAGDYRIIFDVDIKAHTITIFRVRHRSQAYQQN